jgi:hypothetical protein
VLLPAGPKIAFTGGLYFNDHRLICGEWWRATFGDEERCQAS